jgi:ectoine hydroxylase-related dioxygenase (phytanoyl-CoA dioxygenase family)
VEFEISEQQICQFKTDGYLVLPSVFDPSEVKIMQEEADFILELIVNSSLYHQRKSGRLDIRLTRTGQIVRKIQPINDLSLYLSHLSSDQRLLVPLAQLMSEHPILMEEKLNYKEPLPTIVDIESAEMEDRFPVHNDWAYYQAQNYPQEIISSAISMDACTSGNGPICVWPRSHYKHLEHESTSLGLQVQDGLIDFNAGQEILCEAGSVMFFHSVLVHNSRPNTSGRPRRLMIYSHYPTRFNLGKDIRNGSRRLIESPYEIDYLRAKAGGRTKELFSAPIFG